MIREVAPFSADFLPFIPVVYVYSCVNQSSHDAKGTHSDPNPRLVRLDAAEVIRLLIEDIVLTPVDSKVEIDVRGDLAGILTLSVQRKTPPVGGVMCK